MSIEAALARGRAAAENLMVDACVIKRKTGETTVGGVVSPTLTTLYIGKCRVQIKSEAGAGQNVGEAYLVVERHEVQLPITVTGLQEGDSITITASALDPDLVGRVYVIRDVLRKSHLTSRRVTVTEATS
jgi:hypothetical protein